MPKIVKNGLFPHDPLMGKLVIWMIPHWMRPNHITFFRLLTTPLVVWLVMERQYVWAVPVFTVVAFSDAIDGSLARLRNQITEWGEVFDPLADKLLIGSVGLLLIFRYLHWTLIMIILTLELLTVAIGLAMKVRHPHRELKANTYGKAKMITQSFAIGLLLIFALNPTNTLLSGTISALFIVSIPLTVASMVKAGI